MQRAFEFSFATAAAALFIAGCGKSAEQAPVASADSSPAANAPAAGAPAATVAGGDKVRCLGINECKGQSECGVTGSHTCAGQNECKGKGWLKVSTDDCSAKGGKVL